MTSLGMSSAAQSGGVLGYLSLRVRFGQFRAWRCMASRCVGGTPARGRLDGSTAGVRATGSSSAASGQATSMTAGPTRKPPPGDDLTWIVLQPSSSRCPRVIRDLMPTRAQQASIEHGDQSRAGRLRYFSHMLRTLRSLSFCDLMHNDAPAGREVPPRGAAERRSSRNRPLSPRARVPLCAPSAHEGWSGSVIAA